MLVAFLRDFTADVLSLILTRTISDWLLVSSNHFISALLFSVLKNGKEKEGFFFVIACDQSLELQNQGYYFHFENFSKSIFFIHFFLLSRSLSLLLTSISFGFPRYQLIEKHDKI